MASHTVKLYLKGAPAGTLDVQLDEASSFRDAQQSVVQQAERATHLRILRPQLMLATDPDLGPTAVVLDTKDGHIALRDVLLPGDQLALQGIKDPSSAGITTSG